MRRREYDPLGVDRELKTDLRLSRERQFRLFFVACGVGAIVIVGVGVWAVVSLVQWLTTQQI